MSAYRPYPKYKDSGVEWLGEVPEGWEVRPLKFAAALRTQKSEGRRNAIGLENIESWSGRFIETASEFDGEGIAVEAGDILFGKLRPYLAKALLVTEPSDAVGDFHAMRPNRQTHAPFLLYQILSKDFITMVDGSTFGSKMPRASWEFVGKMPIPLPPLPEQLQIASFLDRECGKLDALQAKQERLIELLKEKRQALISHAVTRGPDPTAKLKPSGIEWLGEVPVHWQIEKLWWHFGAEKGKDSQRLTKEYCIDHPGEFPVYSGQTANEGVMGLIDGYDYNEGDLGVLFATTVGAKAMELKHLRGKFSLSQNCMIIRQICWLTGLQSRSPPSNTPSSRTWTRSAGRSTN